MMKPKIIRTEEEYQAALAHIETLMDAAPGSTEEEELELYSLLVEKYEQEHFPIENPDPIDAILFRMDQLGLTRQDLEQYIGSQSKVSEVLNHKRPLSLSMIRSLHDGLEIPADILLQAKAKKPSGKRSSPCDYPFAEMVRKNYFPGYTGRPVEARAHKTELILSLTSKYRSFPMERAFCRSSAKPVNECALDAWQARAAELAEEEQIGRFDRSTLSEDVLRQLVHLSARSSGPLSVKEWLEKLGVAFVVLPHLQNTYLDGACFTTPSGRPVIGITLRHDRLDNFWFTLAHELAHLFLHLNDQNLAFFDDLDQEFDPECNQLELEADRFASNLLIPNQIWKKERDTLIHNCREITIRYYADKWGIHPSIVAGRIRWDTKDYTLCADLIKKEKVKHLFVESGVLG